MYEVKENSRILKDGTKITTYSRDIVSCNILEVEAGTTGYRGGDTGHGGRTYFRIQDAACTDMEIHSYTTRCGSNGFEVCLGGDCELETMIRALKFITKVLEDESKECGTSYPGRKYTAFLCSHSVRKEDLHNDHCSCLVLSFLYHTILFLFDADPFKYFLISIFYISHISAETVFVKFFMCFFIPKTACIR